MVFKSFHELFPKIADIETRFITLLEAKDNKGVPAGQFAFLPAYCADKKCDCRRAIITVQQVDPDFPPFHAASITFGWEDFKFYRAWSNHMPDDMIKNFIKPHLDQLQIQSPHAPFFFNIFEESFLPDEDYMLRIQRHYAYVKFKSGMKLPPELRSLVDIKGACPCLLYTSPSPRDS